MPRPAGPTLAALVDAVQPDGDDGYIVECPDSWAQGRTLFGGLQVALLIRAMRLEIGPDIPLRSLQVVFVAPVPTGRPLHLRVRRLREGKSVLQMEARILDGEQAACTVFAVFGRARESSLRIEPPQPDAACSPEQARQAPYVPGVSPVFTRFLEQRWASGVMPFHRGSEPRTQIYLRFRNEPRVDECLVAALADAIPSPAISLLSKPAQASSMTWTLEFLHDRPAALADGYWLMQAEATAAVDGYVFQTATLWSPDGQPVALSRQSAVVFA